MVVVEEVVGPQQQGFESAAGTIAHWSLLPSSIVQGAREWAEQRMHVEMSIMLFGCEMAGDLAVCCDGVQGEEMGG